MSRRAVILAGGKGLRLRPYTVVLPKPLMPIGEYPIIEVVIRQLIQHRFDHLTIAVNHQAELIETFLGDGSKWKIRIDYSLEKEPLGTIAPLRLIGDLPDNFLVMNADILTELDYARFYEEHCAEGRNFTIAASRRDQPIDYGVLETDGSGRLTGFREKPTSSYHVSMGVYMMNRRTLAHVPRSGTYGFDELMRDMLRAGEPVSVRSFDGYWLDIGRPDDYWQAIDEFDGMRARFLRD